MSSLFPSIKNLLKSIEEESSKTSPILVEEEQYLERNLEKEIQLEDLKTRKEYNHLLEQNRKERKKYAKHIFILTCVWTFLIFLILIAGSTKSINGKIYFNFEISDRVLITLITSTTINFFGFFLLVVKYLFHISPQDKIKIPKRIKSV